MPRSGQATVNTTFRATDRMRGPMRNMQRNVSGFSRNTQRSLGGVSQGFRTLRRVAGLAIAAMTTGAIARSVQSFAAAGDEVAKMSRELGLGAEALQELRFAADRQGVSASDLEKALGALNNRVGQLRQGQGSLYTMLNRSNPELAKQLQNAEDTEEAFTLMMQALNDTTDAQDRAALAQAAFGRSGQTLVRMAEAGSAGLEDLRAEARRLGLVLSDEATAESEKFQDAMTNLKAAMNGVRNNALAPLVTQLTPLLQKMADWVATNQELIQQKLEEAVQKIADISRVLYQLWDNGVIPAILAGVVAFKAITGGLAIYNTTVAAARAATLLFSTSVMSIPVFGWIIAAITAVIAAIVFLIKNWDKVKEVAISAWQGIVEYVQGVWKFLTDFATWLGGIFAPVGNAIRDAFVGAFSFIRDYVQAVWQFISPIVDTIMGVVDKVGGFLNGRDGRTVDEGRQRNADLYGLTTSNTAGLQQVSRSESVNRSEVDVNFRGAPRGTQFSHRGRASGVSLNYGAAGGRL